MVSFSLLSKIKQYSRYSNVGNDVKYKQQIDLNILNFVKGLLVEPPMFNLHREGLGSYKSIIEYLKEYNPDIKIKEQLLPR